tara:strand:- start:255 stop:389 length:135 start_codon:yes stop_codon:yes gene_type:complete
MIFLESEEFPGVFKEQFTLNFLGLGNAAHCRDSPAALTFVTAAN